MTTIDFGNGTGVLKKEELSVTYRFPNTIRKIDDNYLVDFGKAAFGKLEIHMKLMDTLTIHLGEQLNDKGLINKKPKASIRYQKLKVWGKYQFIKLKFLRNGR